MAADVAGPAGDENPHGSNFLRQNRLAVQPLQTTKIAIITQWPRKRPPDTARAEFSSHDTRCRCARSARWRRCTPTGGRACAATSHCICPPPSDDRIRRTTRCPPAIRRSGGSNCFSTIAAANVIWPRTRWRLIGAIWRSSPTWLAERRIQSLTINELADYPAWLNTRKLAAASVARHVVSLKVFFRYLQLEGVLAEQSGRVAGQPKTVAARAAGAIAADDRQAADRADARDALWRRDRALLELLYATGCRASEVSNMRHDDVHLREGFCLAHGKGEKSGWFPWAARRLRRCRNI